MGLTEGIVATLDTVSAALAGEASWAMVSESLVALTGAGTNSLWVGNPLQGKVEILSTSFDANVERSYSDYYHKLDLWTLATARQPLSGPVFGSELVTPDELRRSEIHADFYRPLGIFHLLAAGLPLGGDAGFMALGLHRPETASEFSEEEKHALALVVPQLRLGLRMRHALLRATGAAAAALAGIERFGTAAMILEASGRILFANDFCRSRLAEQGGLSSRNGYLAATHPADQHALATLLKRTARGGMGGMVRLRHPGPIIPPVLLVSRLVDSTLALVLVLDPAVSRRRAKTSLLSVLYGLTPAEADVAAAACMGMDARSIASERGTSLSTVRAQLRQILEKTGAESLRALAATAAALPSYDL